MRPAELHCGRAEAPPLPRAWRHAPVVGWLAAQPRERRDTLLAGLFAVVAGAWAPAGILFFLARQFTAFLLVSLVVLVVVTAPRPSLARARAGRPVADLTGVGDLAEAGEQRRLVRAATAVRSSMGALADATGRRIGAFRAAVDRGGEHRQPAGDLRLGDPLSRWLDGAQSTPSSTR